MSIEIQTSESSPISFMPALDLNVTLDYQIHLINNCFEWIAALKEAELYKQIPKVEKTIVRALVQIANIQEEIKLEINTAEDEEDTNEDTEGN